MPPARTGAPGTLPGEVVIWAWRHPRTRAAEGRCIGRSDAPVDRRKAKRLARRVQRAARAAGLPRVVVTSTLRRSAAVGRWLRRWGWIHRRDPALVEIISGAGKAGVGATSRASKWMRGAPTSWTTPPAAANRCVPC